MEAWQIDWQIVYAVLSIEVVIFIIGFGVGGKSNYVPSDKLAGKPVGKKENQNKHGKRGQPDVSTY